MAFVQIREWREAKLRRQTRMAHKEAVKAARKAEREAAMRRRSVAER